jgi:hypothetical protein
MKKTVFALLMTFVMTMFIGSIVSAEEADTSTKFSGNLRLRYDKPLGEDSGDDTIGIHCMELRVAKQVGDFGVFVNERIGGANYNDLYEGWISYKAPAPIGKFSLGRVKVPFGIYANGLYAPKGIPWDKGWMWRNIYGVRYDGVFPAGNLGVDVAAAFFKNGFLANERNTVSARIGAGLTEPVGLKVGGSVQMGTLKGVPVEGSTAEPEDETKLGIAGDLILEPKMLPIPVKLQGEFINYSLGEADTQKGNMIMAQLDVTPVKNASMIDAATLSLHLSMDSPTEGDSVQSMIAQLKLVMGKQLNVFAQVFGTKKGDEDMSGKGLRVWFMYVF